MDSEGFKMDGAIETVLNLGWLAAAGPNNLLYQYQAVENPCRSVFAIAYLWRLGMPSQEMRKPVPV